MRDKKLEENTFLKIRKGKIATMKKVFKDMGEGIYPYADILTRDELVKCFDYLNGCMEEDDTESIDCAMWSEFLKEAWEEFLSVETKKKLKRLKGILIPDVF